MKINSAILKKNSRSTTNLASQPSTSSLLSQRNSDDDTLNSPRKAKQRRSNSVVYMALKSFKKSFTNLTSDAFMSTPDPPGLANKKIPKPIYHQQTPITQSVSMDSSTTSSSDDALSDIARRKHPEYSGVNIQEIRKVMSPKDSKKRPPIPNFDNCSSSADEKKENEDENAAKKSTILRKRSSSGSRKPLGEINVHDEIFDGKERDMILNSKSNDDFHFPEVGRPSIAQIQGTGVVSRRIQQYKTLSNNSSKFPTTRGISENDPKFAKPKPASHSVLWKKTNVNDTIPEQPTKSQNFGSSRAKSVTSMYSTHRNVLDSVRPSVSATSQISSSRIKKIECGTTISRYPKNA
uniref:Uncharacterized protein n=1 Tax=Panagrolaimus superbus TaxID=310955 RepID=A0A914YW28_9BILA